MPVTPSRALLLGIIFVTLATGLAAPGGASGASIKGTVVLKGATPELRKLAVTIDQYVCGKEKNAEDLLMSPQGFATRSCGSTSRRRGRPAGRRRRRRPWTRRTARSLPGSSSCRRAGGST